MLWKFTVIVDAVPLQGLVAEGEDQFEVSGE